MHVATVSSNADRGHIFSPNKGKGHGNNKHHDQPDKSGHDVKELHTPQVKLYRVPEVSPTRYLSYLHCIQAVSDSLISSCILIDLLLNFNMSGVKLMLFRLTYASYQLMAHRCIEIDLPCC
jgi:hypothetical protein